MNGDRKPEDEAKDAASAPWSKPADVQDAAIVSDDAREIVSADAREIVSDDAREPDDTRQDERQSERPRDDDAEIGAAPSESAPHEPPPDLRGAAEESPGPGQPAPAPPAPRSGGVAAKALTALLLLIAGAALALWGAPKAAPYLPAPVAAWLAPETPDALAAVAALRADVEGRLSALDGRIADASQAAAAASSAAQDAASATDPRLDALDAQVSEALSTAEAAREAVANAGGGVDEAVLDPLRIRLDALESALESAPAGAPASVDGGALNALRERLSALESRIAALPPPADVDALAGRMTALETSLASDVAGRERALAEAEAARRDAAMTAALGQIDRALTLGQPFARPLDALRNSTDVTPPEALAAAAAEGAPTLETLKASFADAAHAAISAALGAQVAPDGGVVDRVFARARSRVTGLPTSPVEGDSTPAVLSRARAEVAKGDLDGAVALIGTLPQAAQEAMAEWTEGARRRAAAEAAMADWRAEIGRAP